MQTPQPAPPPPPARPALAEQPVVVTNTQGGTTITVGTQALPSLAYLRARGSELSRQLNSATSRRSELARGLRRASDEAKPGLQTRITVLDERLVQLERDIADNGRQLALAGGLAATSSRAIASAGFQGGGLPPGNVTAISIVFTLFVLFPIAISMARLLWRRGSRVGAAAPRNAESDLRLQRVEQGVDAIALEVERISEGQRFVTQLMTHGDKQGALGTGLPVADPLHVQLNDTVMAGMRRDARG